MDRYEITLSGSGWLTSIKIRVSRGAELELSSYSGYDSVTVRKIEAWQRFSDGTW
jgi:hypothetical protein